MRTTINIDEDLYRRAKARAATTGRSVSELIEESVRESLRPRSDKAPLPALPVFTGGVGTQPAVDLSNNAAVQALLDEGTPLDALR